MLVDYPYLALALLLLLFPRQWMGVRKRRGRRRRTGRGGGEREEPALGESGADSHVRLLDEWRDIRNFFDIARAFGGAWLLAHSVFTLAPDLGKETARIVELQVLAVQVGALLLGVIVQTVRSSRGLSLVAPVSYIVGLTFGALDAKAAGFTLVLVVALNLVVPRPLAFFFCYTAVLGVFGFFFMGLGKLLLAMCVIVLVPSLLALLTKQRLRTLTARRHSLV